MLSSRPQHALYSDKENAVSAAPSRKANGASISNQAANLLKTPGAKQQQQRGLAKTVKASSSKQALESTQLKTHKFLGAATIALEPGARILGAKDGNNRSGLTGRGGHATGKGKGKALDAAYDSCSLMPPIAHGTAGARVNSPQGAPKVGKKVKTGNAPASATPLPSTKTPARQKTTPYSDNLNRSAAPLKTPRFEPPQTLKRTSPGHNNLFPSFAAFKTPSPNQLLRRRKGAGSPVPFHFNPTSLRSDDAPEEHLESKPPKPTLLDELDAQHALIDDTQEVDCATRQAVDPEDLPVDLPFEMPNYKEMDVLGITFQATFGVFPRDFGDDATPISLDDSEMHLRDYVYEVEPERLPLFPIDKDSFIQKRIKTTPLLSGPGRNRTGAVAKPAGQESRLPTSAKLGVAHERKPKPPIAPVSRPSKIRSLQGSVSRHPAKTPGLLTLSDYPEVVEFELGEIDIQA